MAIPYTFSLYICICFPLGNFGLSGSSQSVNAIYFPFYWEIEESGSHAVGSNAVCCLPLRCDTTPQRPFGCVRAYVNSMNVNFIFALVAIFLRLCFCKVLHYLIVLNILLSVITLSSVYYCEFPACRATGFLPYLVLSSG